MTACTHTPKYPSLDTVPSMQEAMSHCSIVEGEPEVAAQRALTSIDGGTTRIDAAYWSGLDDAQKAAVLAHERAHPCIGMEISCEGCADKVGGYYMRAWGYAPPIVHNAFSTLRVQRKPEHGNIAENARDGARQAERALAARGLLGKTTTEVRRVLSTPTTVTAKPTEVRQVLAPALAKPTSAVVPTIRPVAGVSPASPIQPAPGSGAVDPGGPGTGTLTPAPDGTQAPSDSATEAVPVAADLGSVAGDVVSAVLGESARPHAGKVLLGAGIAAIVAVVLVVIVRRS